jgi:hypothetical protein
LLSFVICACSGRVVGDDMAPIGDLHHRARLALWLAGASAILVATTAWAARPDDDLRRHCSFVDPVYDIPRVWGFMAVFDFDATVVRPAVIDIGILDDGNTAAGGEQCDVTYAFSQFVPANFACGAPVNGAYAGVLPGRTEHGNNMKSIIAATLNDGGRAGVAGQVSVPHLYRFDEVHNYAFEMDATIDRAVSSGATSINISGGFPCAWKPSFFGGTSLDICTTEGRLAATVPLCTVPVPTTDVVAQTVLCAASFGSVVAEGDLRDRMAGAVARARTAGVPIVASAGNVEGGLTGTLSGAVAGNADTLDWRVLPATLPGVISAGSVDPDPPYGNFDFHGPDVDIWAPNNDTSPAAAFVSGLVALAQAIDPQLNPATTQAPHLISATIEKMLVETAYSNAELDAAGHADPSGLRRNLVNPYRFIRRVADGIVPDFEGLGYPNHFDTWVAPAFSGSDGRPSDCNAVQVANDAPDLATAAMEIQVAVDAEQEVGGAILFFDGNPAVADEDWYRLSYAGLAPQGLHATVLELRTLLGFGNLVVDTPANLLGLAASFVDGAEQVQRYRTRAMLGGAELTFRVAGATSRDDNLYRLIVRQDAPAQVRPDRYDVLGPNDGFVQATSLAPGTTLPGVTIADTGILIEVDTATLHTIGDRDHFIVEGFAFPQGSTFQGIVHRVNAGSDDVDVILRTQAGGFVASGRTLVETVLPGSGPFRIEVKSRHPGLFATYDLSIRVKPESLEPPGLASPDRAARELAALIEQLATRIPAGEQPPEIGCATCNMLGARGTIRRDRDDVGTPIITRFLGLERPSELVFSRVGREAAVDVVGRNLRPVAGNPTRGGLVFDLAPGAYVVTWKPGRRDRDLGYSLLSRRSP